MNIKTFIKSLLPGLLPLFVFIIADEIWGTEIGLYVAVVIGVIEIVAIYFKEKRFDKFVLFDTLLIVALGVVSIILDNDIFFKIKPGIIGVILVIILGFSAFSRKNIMMLMSKRYVKNIEINTQQEQAMQRSIKIMFWIVSAHTVLVFYSAFYLSKEAWGFISGVLLYIIFGLFFVIELIKTKYNRKKIKNEEILPEINEKGDIIGQMTRSQAHDGSKRLHPVIHVHILNKKGEILLQKRSKNKKIQPNKWDTAVGGHIAFGEDLDITIKRETFEELGIKNLEYKFIDKYIWKSDIEHELVFVFIAIKDEFDFIPNNEVDEVKYWRRQDIDNKINTNIFTPNFEIEYNKIIKKIKVKKG